MRVRLEVQLAPPAIGYVGVELRRGQIGMSEHFLHRTQVGASLEQVRCERVTQEVRVDARGLEPGLRGAAAGEGEGAGGRRRAAGRGEDVLRGGARFEKRAPPRELETERL